MCLLCALVILVSENKSPRGMNVVATGVPNPWNAVHFSQTLPTETDLLVWGELREFGHFLCCFAFPDICGITSMSPPYPGISHIVPVTQGKKFQTMCQSSPLQFFRACWGLWGVRGSQAPGFLAAPVLPPCPAHWAQEPATSQCTGRCPRHSSGLSPRL